MDHSNRVQQRQEERERNNDEELEDIDEEIDICLAAHAALYLGKEPVHTSAYTGSKWVNEVLQGEPIRCYQQFRMYPPVFLDLCFALERHGLKGGGRTGIHEKVAIFLWLVAHAETSRQAQERFQHSGDTISRHFNEVLRACCGLARENIKPVDPEFRNIHNKISQDRRYWPFFRNAIGAIDGTHIRCIPPPNDQVKYFCRKGYTSQNVMAVCDWDMCFIFVLAGWEGSAHDARIFNHALTTPLMNFPHPPQGKYYLVDAGYPTPDGYLGPYRHARYHLGDFRRTVGRQASADELFNYAHSSLRCTIERTFGIWKNKFRMVREMRSFSYPTQVKIVCATMAIHNFIRRTSIFDPDFTEGEQSLDDSQYDDDEDGDLVEPSQLRSSVSSSRMARLRDEIRDKIVEYRQVQ